MLRHLLHVLLFGVLGYGGTALANQPRDPTTLTQRVNGEPVAAGDIVAPGQSIVLTATAPATTSGQGTYELEIELRHSSQPFTGTRTHSGGVIIDKASGAVEWSGITVTPEPGTWKWQARMRTNNATNPTSNWVMFNAANPAFVVGSGADIVVEGVALSGVNLDSSNDTLTFNVDATFRNRGNQAATNGFTWRAWLSTDKTLQTGVDTPIFSSSEVLNVAAGATATERASVSVNPAPRAGSYYVLIEADPDNAQVELAENNNVGSTPTAFYNGVDLVASPITGAPATVSPGQPITLNVSLRNQGVETPANNPVAFKILASFDDQLDSSDRVVHEGSVTIQGGTVFTSPVTLNRIPANGLAGGDYRWILQVDPSNRVVEASENNNSAVSALPTTRVRQADLQANAVDLVDVNTGVSKRVADVGEPVRFDVNVSNVGDLPGANYKIEFVLSKDNNLSLVPGADILFGETEVTGLQPGAANQRTERITVRLPTTMYGQPLAAGNYYFFVFVDSWNDIHEANETNNTSIVSGQVQLRLPSSDYKTMSVRAPAVAAAGEAIDLTRTIANIGTDSGAEVDYGCFASKNQIIAPGDFPLAFINADGSTSLTRRLQLGRDEVNAATERVRLPYIVPAGNYYIGCLVDPTNAVVELDELNNAAMTNTPVQVSAQSFLVVTQQLPDGVLGVPYQVKLSTTGATEAPTFTTPDADKLPVGLNFSAEGILSGTPTELGVTSFRVIATSGSVTHESVLAVRVLPTSAQLSITTDRLPPAVNSPTTTYEAVLSAAGGAGPYTWTITGMLPNGILLNPNTGNVKGEPRPGTANQEFTFTATVRDQLGGTDSKQLKLRLMPAGALAVSTLALRDAVVGEQYFSDLSASVVGGGILSKPMTWSLVNGSLPPGMALSTHADGATGIINGTPQVAGTYPVTVQVADKDGRFDAVDMMLTVHTSHLRVFTESLPGALHPGDAVDFNILSSSAVPVKFRLYSGALPEGVTLDASGKISGTIANAPTAHGAWNFVVEAVDDRGATGLGVFMLEVVPAAQAQGCGCSTGSAGATGALFALLAMARAIGRRRRS
ncbi:MAG: CARDB domain-containing protein [Myxococcaceae bacterium]